MPTADGQVDDDSLRAHITGPGGLSVSVVTIGCEGGCVDVGVSANGGNPPYLVTWDDNSTTLTRTLCPTTDTRFSVKVEDTPVPAGEFHYEGQTATASVAAELANCADAGTTCTTGGVRARAPAPGKYRGGGTYTCDNDSDPTVAALINNLTVALDIGVDPTTGQHGGKLYVQWGLVVIVGSTELQGTLECGAGPLLANSVDGVWGVPGLDEMSVIPTGTWNVQLKAWSEGPDAVAGTARWEAISATTSNHCDVVYSLTRAP